MSGKQLSRSYCMSPPCQRRPRCQAVHNTIFQELGCFQMKIGHWFKSKQRIQSFWDWVSQMALVFQKRRECGERRLKSRSPARDSSSRLAEACCISLLFSNFPSMAEYTALTLTVLVLSNFATSSKVAKCSELIRYQVQGCLPVILSRILEMYFLLEWRNNKNQWQETCSTFPYTTEKPKRPCADTWTAYGSYSPWTDEEAAFLLTSFQYARLRNNTFLVFNLRYCSHWPTSTISDWLALSIQIITSSIATGRNLTSV